jgi:hypothetical protein
MRKHSRKSRGPKWQNAPLVRGPLSGKAKGELGELAFSHKAASLGFGVAKPHGDNERYDFILDSGERLWRVQVKSTCCARGGGYRAWARGSNDSPYTAAEIDFLVVYVVPLDIWYVIPVKVVTTLLWLGFFPSGCKRNAGRFECYREAWHLMAPGPDATPHSKILRRVHAMACERTPQFLRAVEPPLIHIDTHRARP